MYTVIIAHAPELELGPYEEVIAAADLLVAADGGALPLLRAGQVPHVAIGDFDSLAAEAVAQLMERGAEVLRFPRDKDETDLELALLLAAERGATRIDVLGALGGRWDHTFANVALLTHPALRACHTRLLADNQTLFVVHEMAVIEGQRGDTVSLLPLTATAEGITTHGLLYPLEHATLRYDQARGVSNVLLEPPGRVAVAQGSLLVVQHHDGGAHQWNTGVE